jgi:pilus assembly protein CpaB
LLKRRLIAALAAVLLAGIGAMLLFNYVSAADQRAMAGMQSANVFIVTTAIPQGADATAVTAAVAVTALPVKAVVPGSISDLKQITGLVTTTALLPGEQLLSSRFADPTTLPKVGEVKVPAGLQQVTVSLEAQRVMGGNLVAGARVGVFFKNEKAAERALHNILVTQVQGGLTAPESSSATPAPEAAVPGGSVMVTFALTTPDAEAMIANSSALWLSLESPPTVTGTAGAAATQAPR